MEIDVIVVTAMSKGRSSGAWGQGLSIDEAKRKCKSFGGDLDGGYTILTFGQGSQFMGFDGMGRVHWQGVEPETVEVPPHRSRQKRHPELDRRRSALKRAVPKEISK